MSSLKISGAMAALMLASPAFSATVSENGINHLRGNPLEQEMIDHNVSKIFTPSGNSCVLSVVTKIQNSHYIDGDGFYIPFNEVKRSRAASIQFISNNDTLRLQFKYPIDKSKELFMVINGERFDMGDGIEKSGDTVLLDAEYSKKVRNALEMGIEVRVIGNSTETGRKVIDFIGIENPSETFFEYDYCSQGIEDSIKPNLSNEVTLRATTIQSPERLVPAEEAKLCVQPPTGIDLYHSDIKSTTGFFSQTNRGYASFNSSGEVSGFYIPGIFEAHRNRNGTYSVGISKAANANSPVEENVVSGCLGMERVTMCIYPSEGGDIFAPCIGETEVATIPEVYTPPSQRVYHSNPPITYDRPLPPPLFPPIWGGCCSGNDLDNPSNPGGGEEPPPIPLPAAGWLLLSAFMGLFGYSHFNRIKL
jgi:hypothetical protein